MDFVDRLNILRSLPEGAEVSINVTSPYWKKQTMIPATKVFDNRKESSMRVRLSNGVHNNISYLQITCKIIDVAETLTHIPETEFCGSFIDSDDLPF